MADNITVSDANDVDRVVRTTDTASVHVPHHIVDSSALPTGAATQTTLAALNTKVTAVDTGAVTVASSALPSGAATSTLQTSGNASLTTLAGAVAGSEIQADIVTSALPSGASTESTLSTLNGKVTACNTGAVVLATGSASVGTVVLGAGSAAVGTIALGAGSASIGKLGTANDGVDIGDVDVASVAMPTTVYHGRKLVTALTDEVIAGSNVLKSGVTVKANAGNVGLIYVGVEGVAAATGFELSAKESVFIECDNTNRVWTDAATGSADGITYIAS